MMAVTIRLRDVKITQSMIDGDGIMTCDRCKIPLSGPTRKGYPRQLTNACVRYIVMPGSGGERSIDNSALLCGDCEEIHKTKIYVHRMFYDDWCNEYVGQAVSEEQDSIDAEGDWSTGPTRSGPAEPPLYIPKTIKELRQEVRDEQAAQAGVEPAPNDLGPGDVGSNDNK